MPRHITLKIFSPIRAPAGDRREWEHALEAEKEIELGRDGAKHLTADHANFYVHIYKRGFLSFELDREWLLRLSFENSEPFFLGRFAQKPSFYDTTLNQAMAAFDPHSHGLLTT